MIFNFFKKDKRSEHKKLIDEIDAAYIAKGGKKISDEAIRKAKETLKQVYEQGEKTELRLLTESNRIVPKNLNTLRFSNTGVFVVGVGLSVTDDIIIYILNIKTNIKTKY